MKKITLFILGIWSVCILTACGAAGKQPVGNSELENGVSAIEDAMSAGNSDDTEKEAEDMEDLQEGTIPELLC